MSKAAFDNCNSGFNANLRTAADKRAGADERPKLTRGKLAGAVKRGGKLAAAAVKCRSLQR